MPAEYDLMGDFDGSFPFQPRYQQVADDVRLHYVEDGSGQPILLLHGNPTWSYLYRRFLPPLGAAGFRAIAVDHMGFGRSDRPPGHERYRLRSHVDNLLAFIRELDLRDITLVMQDWGGPIGLGAAVEEPDRVARLVIMNTWIAVLPEGIRLPFHDPFRTRGLGEILALGANLFVEAMFAGMRPESATPLVAAAYRAPFPDYYSRVPVLAFARDIPIGDEHPTAPYMMEVARKVAELRRPTLIAWGMQDRVLPPAILEGWRGVYPHAEVMELPQARHYLQEDEPEAITERIVAFLRSTS
ncbi:MAG TPA: alpha/beta fold hydrolase [Actinomycetota bacterium]|nr:alpha/beta fold hydrolase [Actinomycetota bacterium]